MTEQEDNWLNANYFDCPECGFELFRVDRSPFYDEWKLNCWCCAKSVEISYYDPKVPRGYFSGDMSPETRDRKERELEEMLSFCECGGAFSFKAPPRCFSCGSVVLEDFNVDIFPSFNRSANSTELTIQQREEFERFNIEFRRSKNIWK